MRRSVKYGLYGAVLATVLGGTVAWANADKTVTLNVDGNTRKISTTAGNVGGALADAGYTAGPHDIVAPALTASIHDGSTIVLDRGRELRLDVDGKVREVWVTAPTVSQALADLGYPLSDFTSVSRSQRLPLSLTDIEIRSPKQVTLVHDHVKQVLQTTDNTVGELLRDAGVTLGKLDQVHPSLSSALHPGQKVVVQRIHDKQYTDVENVNFPITTISDPSMYQGETQIVTAGTPGTARVTFDVVYVDGVAEGRTIISSTQLTAPSKEIEKVGTKARPVPAAPPVSTNGLNWQGVANCESGGNWSINTGNGYYGGLQFTISTWLAYGGGAYAPRPDLASEADQIAVANRLYAADGSAPWPVCGQYL